MTEKKSNSIEKALEILLSFTPYNQEMGTVELAQKLGLHKATASRIILILTSRGFLQQNPATKKYMLGPAAFDIGRAANYSLNTDMVQLAKPFIDELRNTLSETTVLEVISGTSTVMAYVAEGPQRVRIAGSIGDRLPHHAAAGAKAILAFSPKEITDTVLGDDLPSLTPNTITDPKAYKRELKEIRHRGFSLDREEIDIGINAIGAPIFNHEDRPVAAVVVAGPSQRLTGEEDSQVVRLVRETAARISERLHHRGGIVDEQRKAI
jgi:IclR family acetate operon transcriptional repressor